MNSELNFLNTEINLKYAYIINLKYLIRSWRIQESEVIRQAKNLTLYIRSKAFFL